MKNCLFRFVKSLDAEEHVSQIHSDKIFNFCGYNQKNKQKKKQSEISTRMYDSLNEACETILRVPKPVITCCRLLITELFIPCGNYTLVPNQEIKPCFYILWDSTAIEDFPTQQVSGVMVWSAKDSELITSVSDSLYWLPIEFKFSLTLQLSGSSTSWWLSFLSTSM